MKIVLNTKKIGALISTVAINNSKKNLIPIHDYVLLEASEGRLTATKMTEACQISQFYALGDDQKDVEFAACVNCDKLLNVIKTLKVEEVSLELKIRKNGTRYVFIKYGKNSCKLNSEDTKHYQKKNFATATQSIKTVGDTLFSKIKSANLCVNEKDVRPAFTAVAVSANDKGSFVSGFTPILGTRQKVDVIEGNIDPVFIPKYICNLLDPQSMKGNTEISVNARQIKINNGAFELIGTLIDSQPLNLAPIYDQKRPDFFTVEKEILVDSITRILNFTPLEDNMVILSFTKEDLTVTSDCKAFGHQGEEIIPVIESNVEEFLIALDGRALLTCSKDINCKNIRFYGREEKQPVFVSEETGYDQDWCLSPIYSEQMDQKRKENEEKRKAKIAKQGKV